MLVRSVYHLELNALDAGAVLRAVPVGMLVLPHDDVELAARLVAEHETDVTMTIVLVDEPRAAVVDRAQIIVAWYQIRTRRIVQTPL